MSSRPPRWADLLPDPHVAAALDRADTIAPYARVDAEGSVHDKKNWSNRFADACARGMARLVRSALGTLGGAGDLVVLPSTGGGAEPPVVLGEGSRKRIDVAVVHRLGGLRMDISCKGLNFRDGAGGQFDKNLTGRTYELEDELRSVRRLQPSAFVFALYWMPLGATTDKVSGESSLARAVVHLRARTQRGSFGSVRDPDRLDAAAIALYAPTITGLPSGEHVQRGVTRCLDVTTDPPRRGRPRVDTTLGLDELAMAWVRHYLDAVGAAAPNWAEPEPDDRAPDPPRPDTPARQGRAPDRRPRDGAEA